MRSVMCVYVIYVFCIISIPLLRGSVWHCLIWLKASQPRNHLDANHNHNLLPLHRSLFHCSFFSRVIWWCGVMRYVSLCGAASWSILFLYELKHIEEKIILLVCTSHCQLWFQQCDVTALPCIWARAPTLLMPFHCLVSAVEWCCYLNWCHVYKFGKVITIW